MDNTKLYTVYDPDHQKEGEIDYIFDDGKKIGIQWDDGCYTTHSKSNLTEDTSKDYDFII